MRLREQATVAWHRQVDQDRAEREAEDALRQVNVEREAVQWCRDTLLCEPDVVRAQDGMSTTHAFAYLEVDGLKIRWGRSDRDGTTAVLVMSEAERSERWSSSQYKQQISDVAQLGRAIEQYERVFQRPYLRPKTEGEWVEEWRWEYDWVALPAEHVKAGDLWANGATVDNVVTVDSQTTRIECGSSFSSSGASSRRVIVGRNGRRRTDGE